MIRYYLAGILVGAILGVGLAYLVAMIPGAVASPPALSSGAENSARSQGGLVR